MNDDNVKTTETKSKYSSDSSNGDTKTKEVSTEKKTSTDEKPDKTIIQTTTTD